MPATDIERLVVQLSADVRGYQKSLDKARAATNRTAGDIERRFGRMNKSLSGFGSGLKSAFAGFGAGLASSLTVSAIGDMIKSVAKLNDQAEQIGVSAESLQALGFAARQNGAEVDDLVKSLGILTRKVGEAQQKQKGPLFEIFAANQKQFSTDVMENFRTIAELIRNAKTEADKFVIGTAAFGKGFQVLLPLLNKGAQGIRELESTARASGAVIDERLVKRAAEFDDQWTKAFDVFSVSGKAAVIAVADEIAKLIESTGEFGEMIKKILDLIPKVNIGAAPTLKSTGGGLLGLLGVGENLAFGGSPLDQLKQKFKDLQKEMDALVVSNAPEQAIIDLQAQIRRTREEIERLQRALTGLTASGNVQFKGPTTGPASGNFGGPSTVIPSSLDEAGDKLTKAGDGLLEVISKRESNNNPNAVFQPFADRMGGQNFSLVTMSIREVLALQRRMLDTVGSSPVGQFQITRDTLIDFAKQMNLSLDDKFTADLQRKIAEAIVASTGGSPDKLKGRFESLQGFSNTDLVNAFNLDADAVARGNDALSERENILRAVAEANNVQIDQLKVEQAELGAVTQAQKEAARALELTNQLKQQGIDINDPQVVAFIKEKAAAYATEAQALDNVKAAQDSAAQSAEALQAAQEQAAQTAQAVAGAFGSAFQGFISDLAHGKKLTDALRDALLKLGESLLNIALDNLLGGIGGGGGGLGGGGGGGGILGSLFGGLFHGGGVAGHGGHGRRVPALAFAGAPRYHGGGFAGLQQGEVPAILKRGEIIFPNMDAVRNAVSRQGGGAGGGIVQNNTFVSPSWKAAERSQNQIARTAGASLDRVRRTL